MLWKMKTLMPLWCFEGTFSAMVCTSDWGLETSKIFEKQERKIPHHAVFKCWPQGFNFILPVTHSMTLALFSFLEKEVNKSSNLS